jgi:hypothetical protein
MRPTFDWMSAVPVSLYRRPSNDAAGGRVIHARPREHNTHIAVRQRYGGPEMRRENVSDCTSQSMCDAELSDVNCCDSWHDVRSRWGDHGHSLLVTCISPHEAIVYTVRISRAWNVSSSTKRPKPSIKHHFIQVKPRPIHLQDLGPQLHQHQTTSTTI